MRTDLKLKDLELTKLREANRRILDIAEKELVAREAALIRKHERAVSVLVREHKEKVEDMGVNCFLYWFCEFIVSKSHGDAANQGFPLVVCSTTS